MPDSIITAQDVLDIHEAYYRDHYMSIDVMKALKVLTADLQAEQEKQIVAMRRYNMARGME
jgi:hypothetical protein